MTKHHLKAVNMTPSKGGEPIPHSGGTVVYGSSLRGIGLNHHSLSEVSYPLVCSHRPHSTPSALANVIEVISSFSIFGTMAGTPCPYAGEGVADDWKRVGDEIRQAMVKVGGTAKNERQRA